MQDHPTFSEEKLVVLGARGTGLEEFGALAHFEMRGNYPVVRSPGLATFRPEENPNAPSGDFVSGRIVE
jgi:hypothetical protein